MNIMKMLNATTDEINRLKTWEDVLLKLPSILKHKQVDDPDEMFLSQHISFPCKAILAHGWDCIDTGIFIIRRAAHAPIYFIHDSATDSGVISLAFSDVDVLDGIVKAA